MQDARETKEIEMPERYANTFVLKVTIFKLFFFKSFKIIDLNFCMT